MQNKIEVIMGDGSETPKEVKEAVERRIAEMPRDQAKQWWLVDRTSGTTLRGPYKYAETAAAVRQEMEDNASDEKNERWNLCIEWREPEQE